jgi:hypothetical protein
MAVATLLDLNALAIELEELGHAELEISARRRELHQRLNFISDELTQREEREVSDERQAIHRRIDELRELFGQRY